MNNKAIDLINTLEKTFRIEHRLRMLRAASHSAAVLSSPLFVKCLEIQQILQDPDPVEDLEVLLNSHAIPRPPCGLPPFSTKLLLARLEQIYSRMAADKIYTVQLPDNHPSCKVRRSGLILRQHLVHGQLKALFIAGTEQNSPANCASNLQCGDRLLAVSGFPLDWRTLELHHWGLLDAEELKGLRSNANLYDLACHLLNEPYRRTHKLSRSDELDSKPLLVLACRTKLEKSNEMESDSLQRASSKSPMLSSTRSSGEKHGEMEYRETILDATNEDSGLGLQLGFDEDSNGIHIVSILPNSQAALDGILREGDQIIEVNYQNITALDSREALKKIKAICQKNSFVHIKVACPIHDLDDPPAIITDNVTHESMENFDSSRFGTFPHVTPDYEPMGRTNSFVEAKPTKGTLLVDQIYIDEEPAIETPNREDLDEKYAYQLDYWKNQFPPGVEILVTEYDISHSNCGLGISIEGTLEQDDGDSTLRPHHYVVDLAPQGPIQIQGILKPEDELLEVNENILYGEEHLKVARILHNIAPQGYIICARYKKVSKANSPIANSNNEPPPRSTKTNSINSSGHTMDSEETSDVDRNPTPPRIIIARSSVFSPEAEKDRKARNNDQLHGESKANQPTELIMMNKAEPEETLSRTIDVTGLSPDPHCQGSLHGETYPRLPMPAQLANLPEVSKRREQMRPQSIADSSSRMNQVMCHESSEVVFKPEEHCLSITIVKRAGEFFGLEIDSEDGGPDGIQLLSIIPGSPLDRLNSAVQQRFGGPGSCSSLTRYSTSSDLLKPGLPLPRPGDWIASVAGYTFRNRPNFKARRLLRRLVTSAGTFEICYIPPDWILQIETRTGESTFSSIDSDSSSIQRVQSSESDRIARC